MIVSNEPMVSIIITCYNFADYIADCIRSVLAQDYDSIELFICDDGSSDESAGIIRSLVPEVEKRGFDYHLILMEHNENDIRNLNRVISECNGIYIKLLDGDDILLENSISRCVDYLNDNPECGMVYTDYYEITESEHFPIKTHEKSVHSAYEPGDNMAQALYERCSITAPTVLRRKEIYDTVGLYDEGLKIADWGNYIDIALNYKIGCIHEATAAYRVRENSASHFVNDDKGRESLLLMVKSEMKVLDKYLNDDRIDSKPGIENICNQAISVAINIGALDVIDLVKRYVKDHKCRFNLLMTIKLFLYERGLWDIITFLR